MIEFVKSFAKLGYHQAKNLLNISRGLPLTIPSLGSMTLDDDDLTLANIWLNKKSDWYNPHLVNQYQTQFAQWNGSKYAFAFMGGRVALSALINALDLKADDEVIIPGYTCVVVPNAFRYAGVNVIYNDIELETYGLDATYLESKITSKTKAILLHHLYGLVCRDYEKIIEIAQQYNLYVIEDCAHSTGAKYKGLKVGNLGDCAFYSSEQSKIFNTIMGGVAVTNNSKIADKLEKFYHNAPYPNDTHIEKLLSNVILKYYQFKHPQRWWLGDLYALRFWDKQIISTTKEEENGIRPDNYGCKMPAPIAVLGLNQLQKINHYNQQRCKMAQYWHEWCCKNGYTPPLVIPESEPVYLRYPVLVEPKKKKKLTWGIKDLGVKPGVWFVSCIHPVPTNLPDCQKANIAVERCINFPTLK